MPVLRGIVLGLGGAWGLTRLMAKLLYGVSPTYAVVALFLALIAMLATYVPARRATRVQPVEALRQD